MIKIKIRKKHQVVEPLPVEPIVEARYKVDLGNISEDKVVALLKRWREFLHTLSNEDKRYVRQWACGDCDSCSPENINRISKAIKGSLD